LIDRLDAGNSKPEPTDDTQQPVDPVTTPPSIEDENAEPTEEPSALVPPQNSPFQEDGDAPPSDNRSPVADDDGDTQEPAVAGPKPAGEPLVLGPTAPHWNLQDPEDASSDSVEAGQASDLQSEDEPSQQDQQSEDKSEAPATVAKPVVPERKIDAGVAIDSAIGQLKFILELRHHDTWKGCDPETFNYNFGPGSPNAIIKRLITDGKWSSPSQQGENYFAYKKLDGDEELKFSWIDGIACIRYKGGELESNWKWIDLFGGNPIDTNWGKKINWDLTIDTDSFH